MKKLNQKIFWFKPEQPKYVEFRQVPQYLCKMISYYSEINQLDQIVKDYLINFPDSWDVVFGMNLFFNSKNKQLD